MHHKKYHILILLLSVPSVLVSQNRLDGIAAIVGDEIILHSEVNQLSINMALQMKLDVSKETEELQKIKKDVLEDLITSKILLDKARQDTVVADDQQIEQVLEDQVKQWVQQLGTESKVEEYFGLPISKIKKQFREEVRNRLMVERVQQNYVQKVSITRPEVETFYATFKDSIPQVGEMVKISAILREVRATGTGREEALSKIKQLRERIVNGEDMGEIAKVYSEDPGSASRGGELGLIQRGDFVQEFEEVAFKLEPGVISEVVETKYGFHIIKLIERRGEKINVRHILIQLEPTDEDAQVTKEFLVSIADSCRDGGDFAKFAEKHSQDETSSGNGGSLGWFQVDQLQIKEFKDALFGMKPGDISYPFKTEYGYFIIRLDDHREAGELSLENDWQQIEQFALNRKRAEQLGEWVNELRGKIYIEIK